MGIDLTKLSSGPWEAERSSCGGKSINTGEPLWSVSGTLTLGDGECGYFTRTDAEFIALARNAFDVLMRRGWAIVRRTSSKWVASAIPAQAIPYGIESDDPFTALVEADKWMKKQEGKNG